MLREIGKLRLQIRREERRLREERAQLRQLLDQAAAREKSRASKKRGRR